MKCAKCKDETTGGHVIVVSGGRCLTDLHLCGFCAALLNSYITSDFKITMFEHFTDRARKVMALANQEAQHFHHEYIGTEHILLGIVKEGGGMGDNVLEKMDIDLRKVRIEVEKLVKSGPDMVTMGKLPHTPRTKKAIEYAVDEARKLNHNYVGTEHLLLGLLREDDGVAAMVLKNLGLELEEVRHEMLNLIGSGVETEEPVVIKTETHTFTNAKNVTSQPVFKVVKKVEEPKTQSLVASQFEAAESALRQLIAALSPYGTVEQIQNAARLLEDLRVLREKCKSAI